MKILLIPEHQRSEEEWASLLPANLILDFLDYPGDIPVVGLPEVKGILDENGIEYFELEKNALDYVGVFGEWFVDLDTGFIYDHLDRDQIWISAGKNYKRQQNIYFQILDDAGIEKYASARNDSEFWAGDIVDLGVLVHLKDGRVLRVDANETAIE